MEGPIPRDPDDSAESDGSQTPEPEPDEQGQSESSAGQSAEPDRDVWVPGEGASEPVGAAALPVPSLWPLADGPREPTGEPYPEAPRLEPIYGYLHPLIDAEVDVDAVLGVFERYSALAGLHSTHTGPGVSREFVVLVDPDDHVATLVDDRLSPGPVVTDIAQALVAATGNAVEIGSVMLAIDPGEGSRTYGSPVDTEQELSPPTDHHDVLLARLAEETLPLLARHVGSPLEVWDVDAPQGPCVMVRPVELGARLSEHRFPSAELPVVSLSRLGGSRSVAVLTHPGHLPDVFLTHREPWLAALSSADTDNLPAPERAALDYTRAWFAEPHLAPGSELMRLLAVAPPDIDAQTVAHALQSPDDEGWWHRVLAALGVPTVLADLAEGRPVGTPRVVQMATLRTAIAHTLRLPGAGRTEPLERDTEPDPDSPGPSDPDSPGPSDPDS